MDVLALDLCGKIFSDCVERPYIPLYYVLDYEPYKLALGKITPQTFSHGSIKQWLKKKSTFISFKDTLIDMIRFHKMNLNIEAISESDWMTYIPENEEIALYVKDVIRGGGQELQYNWFPVLEKDNKQNLILLTKTVDIVDAILHLELLETLIEKHDINL